MSLARQRQHTEAAWPLTPASAATDWQTLRLHRYSESLPELYAQARFRFDRLCPLQHFLSATPAGSLAQVRSVRFEWVTYTFIYGSDYVADYVERIWAPVWAGLVGLEGLRELTVSVRPGWAGGWTVLGAARERCEDMLFGPVRRLEGGGVVLRCEAC